MEICHPLPVWSCVILEPWSDFFYLPPHLWDNLWWTIDIRNYYILWTKNVLIKPFLSIYHPLTQHPCSFPCTEHSSVLPISLPLSARTTWNASTHVLRTNFKARTWYRVGGLVRLPGKQKLARLGKDSLSPSLSRSLSHVSKTMQYFFMIHTVWKASSYKQG